MISYSSISQALRSAFQNLREEMELLEKTISEIEKRSLVSEESQEEFRVGDVVCLKSGGPRMTISNMSERDGKLWIRTIWMSENDRETNTAEFRSTWLVRAKGE